MSKKGKNQKKCLYPITYKKGFIRINFPCGCCVNCRYNIDLMLKEGINPRSSFYVKKN